MEKQSWMELLPIDRYKVSAKGLLHNYDRKVLTMLYQPLIGSRAFSLYMTLWGELEQRSCIWKREYASFPYGDYANATS